MATSERRGDFALDSDLKWSPPEKAIARRAFDRALQRSSPPSFAETKRRAAKIKEHSDLWDLEEFLKNSRKEIDFTYDYRYSQLLIVFGVLLRKGRLKEEDLRGLDEEKLERIRRIGGL